MIKLLLLFYLFLFLTAHAGEDWGTEIQNQIVKVIEIKKELKKQNLSEKEITDFREKEAVVLANIQNVGDARPDNPAAQLAVGRSLASVEEAPRAVVYAERGLTLAEASGDQKLVREALLTGAQIYEKTGQYDLARERAQRALKNNPKDKEALAVYMMVKDRVSGGTPSSLSAANGAGAASPSASVATSRSPAESSVVMTSASSLAAQKYLADARRKMALDPQAALGSLDLAIEADPKSAIARVERSKARLASGDVAGGLEDAEAAVKLDSSLGAAYAARAEAKRMSGRTAEEMAADYEKAAKLDGRYAEAYKTLLSKMGGTSPAKTTTDSSPAAEPADSAPDAPRGMLPTTPKGWGLFALICAVAAVLGFVFAPLRIRRRSK